MKNVFEIAVFRHIMRFRCQMKQRNVAGKFPYK
jgi:hypothetical protein